MQIIGEKKINIVHIISALQEGKTLVYPTETCYGLGCDATNPSAVEKIYEIKERPKEKSLILIAASLDMMEPYITISYLLSHISKNYWPGPLTVVVPIKQDVALPSGVVRDDGTIAFRVSSHPIAADISRALGRPIVSTSANIGGGANPYTIEEVVQAFRDKSHQPDILIDAGELPRRAPSTVVRLVGDQIDMLRQGDIFLQM